MNNINAINTLSEIVGNSIFRHNPTTAPLSEFVGFPFKGPDKSYGTRQTDFRHTKNSAIGHMQMNNKSETLASGLNKMTHHEVAIWRVTADVTIPSEIRVKAMGLLADLMTYWNQRT